jgi:hypothetical protein
LIGGPNPIGSSIDWNEPNEVTITVAVKILRHTVDKSIESSLANLSLMSQSKSILKSNKLELPTIDNQYTCRTSLSAKSLHLRLSVCLSFISSV